MDLNGALEKIADVKILVVGDLMLDRYWWGDVDRISPEAPVPVVAMKKETSVLGGAANVAANVVGLGGTVQLCGVVGDDGSGRSLISTLAASNISADGVMKIADRPTTVKTRILAQHQQVARVDRETSSPLRSEAEAVFISDVLRRVESADVILISDYNKGLLSESILSSIIRRASEVGRKVVVDPKGKEFRKYSGAYMLTPNHRETMEAAAISSNDEASLTSAGAKMIAELGLESLLVTRGEHGMLLLRRDGEPYRLSATAKDVYDVTGAGDTVIAALCCGIAAGLGLEDSVTLANYAAGIVIEHLGTTAITRSMLAPQH